MATRDESHLFSLAALTTRSLAAPPPPSPPARAPHTSDLELRPPPELPLTTVGAGWPLFPLGAPLGGVVEPPAAEPRLRASRGRTLALVVAACVLGAGIVTAAAWPAEPATPPTLLGPEISTDTLTRPAVGSGGTPRAAPAPPAAIAAEPAPQGSESASATPVSEPAPTLSKPPRRNARPPVPPTRNRGVTPPAPPPARGPCAHCASGDLACNIKCRAGG